MFLSLQRYFASESNADLPPAPKPRRDVPNSIWRILAEAEKSDHHARTDAIAAVLAWSDDLLKQLAEKLAELIAKTHEDQHLHAFVAQHPWKSIGIAIACGSKDGSAIAKALAIICLEEQKKRGVKEWVGVGVEVASADGPYLIFYNVGP
jgi:ElaB/YqjD/DUF883 family membrane-anchored ribosome-binding protein